MNDRGVHAEAIQSLQERREAHQRPKGRIYPNVDVQNAGRLLTKHARTVTEAIAHLKGELDCIGYPAKSGDKITGTGSDEGDGLHATHLTDQLEALRDTKDRIKRDTYTLVQMSSYILKRTPNVEDEPRCRDAQVGREGAIEWGDPLCVELGVSRGLCGREAKAEARWRQAKGYPSRAEEAA